jgi:hypothetical protein
MNECIGYKTDESNVIWVDLDNGLETTLDRFSALGRTKGVEKDAAIKIFTMPEPWPFIMRCYRLE